MNIFSQDFQYREDTRSQNMKEDSFNQYQSEQISELDLIRALAFAGIHIYKIPLRPFDKKYTIVVTMDEYVQGKKIKSKNIIEEDNTYIYTNDSIATEESVPYIDYIDQITFYMKDNDSINVLELRTYAGGSKMHFKKNITRENQFYNWRSYSKTDWILNENIPLLVYASSWYDEKYKIERFCGVVDLSLKKEYTDELLNNSPHYFAISYKISE
jgi:hypothetical protein